MMFFFAVYAKKELLVPMGFINIYLFNIIKLKEEISQLKKEG